MPVPSEGKSERRGVQAQREKPGIPMSSDEDVVWVRVAPSQVVRTVAVALSTAAALLRALSVRAGTNFHRLVRHRPLSGGHPQPALDSSTGNIGFRCVKEV
jgi:hypothetical protein